MRRTRGIQRPRVAPAIRVARTFVVAATVGLAPGCDPADEEPASATGQDPPSARVTSVEPSASTATVFTIEGLEGPEAVRYDSLQDVYFISNFGPSDDPLANDGYLSRVSAEDGSIIGHRWAVGDDARPLREPRGMALALDTLWVADASGLHAFDPVTGAQLDFVDMTALEPGFLNDVAAGADGGVYVTDTGTSRLIRIDEGRGIVVANGPSLGSPNGVTLERSTGRLVLVPWEGGGDSLRVWDPVHRTLEVFGRTPGGRFDGAEFAAAGLIVASQADSALHLVRDGAGRPFQKVAGRPADIAVDTRRGHIAVPYIALDRVDVYPAPPPR